MGLHEGQNTTNRRQALATVAGLATLSILLQGGGEDARNLLAWDRSALHDGEIWRLVSGHFVHLGWSHLTLNLAGLALVVWITGRTFSLLQWFAVVLLTIAVIDAGFWYLYGNLDWYVGLSGLLHGLLIAGLSAGVLARDRESRILAALVLAKLIWEQAVGPLPGSESTSGGAVIVDAHLYGAVGGLLAALVLRHRVRPGTSI